MQGSKNIATPKTKNLKLVINIKIANVLSITHIQLTIEIFYYVIIRTRSDILPTSLSNSKKSLLIFLKNVQVLSFKYILITKY